MREIKFRGISRSPYKYWVHGIGVVKNSEGDILIIENTCSNGLTCVMNESVGQYVGIKDKNGKEVYEGDIFECCEGNLYEVSFCESYLRFEATELYMRESYELNDFICAGNNYDDILDGRIIGNRFENKELYDVE